MLYILVSELLAPLYKYHVISFHHADYIDFNNGSVQYRMLKQMEYGIALFASQDRHYKSHREWSVAPNRFYSSGQLEKRASIDIHITEAVELEITSNRGIMIYLEEDEEQT